MTDKIHMHTCILMNVEKTLNTYTVMDSQVSILIWGDLETIVDSPRKLLVQFSEADKTSKALK